MNDTDQGPHHLAEVIFRALSITETSTPDPALLAFFFDVLYQASFRVEQGRSTIGSILWQEPATLLSRGETEQAGQNWSYLSFNRPIPFNVNSLVPLAQGLDPRMSALLVHAAAPQSPLIHGLVSYNADPSLPLPSALEEPDGPPCVFRTTIAGPAHLMVEVGLEHQIELKRNHLYTHAHDVLRRGPVRARLSARLADLLPTLKAQLPGDIASSPLFEAKSLPLAGGSVLINEAEWSDMVDRLWIGTLTHILLQVYQNREGGAVLVTSNRLASQRIEYRMTLQYASAYPQLRLSLEQRSLFAMVQHVLSAQALVERTSPLKDISPDDLVLQEPKLSDGSPGNDQEIRQGVAFIASLARIDGFLLLTPQLDLCGFGGQPSEGTMPEEVYLAGDEMATQEQLTPIPYRSFGPRNQALIRQCYQDRDAIAFAFTQDGDLRAMMWLDGKIVVWNRVRLRGV